jgi:hypothetical protein
MLDDRDDRHALHGHRTRQQRLDALSLDAGAFWDLGAGAFARLAAGQVSGDHT